MAAKGPTPQSDIPRWVRTSRERPRWDERNRMIAAYVPPGSSVLDLGAGAQTLADHLPPGCVYTPADVVPGPGVLLCDLDADRWPEIAERHDIAVCSGVLEYLQDVPRALAGLAGVATRAIVTYSDRSRAQRIETRMRQGWHSHLTLSELRAALDGLEAEWRFLTEWRGHVICAIDFEAGLPPLRDGDALIEEAAWESAFSRLEAYARRTGGARVPNSLVEDGVGLGAWVQAQRRLRRRGTLSARRTARLEALPGWTWRSGRSTPGAAPEIAREPGVGEGSLRPLRVELDRADWMAKAAQGDPVLDMTAGQGSAAIALARAGLQVVGSDRDAEALEQLRTRLSEETPETRRRLTLVKSEGGVLPLADKGFDSVLLADVGEETAALLEEANRLLRPRGRIVFTTQLDVSPRGLERPRASLARLIQAFGPSLRPVQIVDGDRWIGVVAVFGEAGAEPWTALLEVAESRLTRLGDAYAERVVLLEETRERERELAARLDDAVAAGARYQFHAETRGREAEEAVARRAEEVAALRREAAEARERAASAVREAQERAEAVVRAAEQRAETAVQAAEERADTAVRATEERADTVVQSAEERATTSGRAAEELRGQLAEARRGAEARRSEDAEALERERARGLELTERLGRAEAGRDAEARRAEELDARLEEGRARREALEAALAEAVAKGDRAREEATAAREHAERAQEAFDAQHAAREQMLRDVREDGRALARELDRRRREAATLEAELRAAGERASALQAELGRATAALADAGAQRDALAAERDGVIAARDAFAAERDALAAERHDLVADGKALAARVAALETELAGAKRQASELEDAVAERDRRIAHRERVAIQRDRDAAAALEAARAEEAATRAELEAARARERDLRRDLRVQTARAERDRRLLDSIRAGRAYRLSMRLWRIRRRVRHPLGGPKKKPELPAAE